MSSTLPHPLAGTAGGSGNGGDSDDLFLIRSDLGLFAVASPLGTSDVAARFALNGIERALATLGKRAASHELREVLLKMYDAWLEVGGSRGLGAAIAVVVAHPAALVVAHMGDCAVFLIRGQQVLRRTDDHVTQTRATRSAPHGRRAITRGFGMSPNPEIHDWAVQPDDRLLLSSAVHHALGEPAVVAILSAAKNANEAVQELLDRTVAKRGRIRAAVVCQFLPTGGAG